MQKENEKLFSIAEASRASGVDPATLRHWVKAEYLKAVDGVRDGVHCKLVSLIDVWEEMKARGMRAKPPAAFPPEQEETRDEKITRLNALLDKLTDLAGRLEVQIEQLEKKEQKD